MQNITRRTILTATAASAAALTVAVPVIAAEAQPAEPLLALEAKWRGLLAEQDIALKRWRAAHDALPVHAQGGYPRIPEGSTLFDVPLVKPFVKPGIGISLPDLRKVNRKLERFERTVESGAERLAQVRAEGRARVRWWIDTYRDGKRLRDASNLEAATARTEEIGKRLTAIENEMFDASATTFEGVRIKLAFLAHSALMLRHADFHGNMAEPLDEWEYEDRSLYNLHLDVERIAGGAA